MIRSSVHFAHSPALPADRRQLAGAAGGVAALAALFFALALLLPRSVHAQPARDLDLNIDAIVGFSDAGSSTLSQYVPTVLTSRNGLPENAVRSIDQSADGYVWLATEEGLVRYDGNRTRVFDRTTDPGLRDNFIQSVSAAPDSSVWVSTQSGVHHLVNGTFVAHVSSAGYTLRLVFCDSAGTVWVGTEQGLFTVNPVTTELSPFRGIPGSVVVRQLRSSPDGSLWAATSDGLWSIIHGRAARRFGFRNPLDSDLKTVAVADDGSIWLATATDVVHWRNGELRRLPITSLAAHGRVTSLLVDHSGKLWVGFQKDGIAILDGNRISHYRGKDGLPNDAVKALMRDRDDNLWVGMNGNGAVRFHAGLFTTYGAREGLSESTVFLARTAHDNSVWTATQTHLNHVFPNGHVESIGAAEGLPSGVMGSMFEDRDGTLWVGSDMGDLIHVQGRKVTVFHNPDHAQDPLRSIARGPGGDLYLLYPTQFGLVRFHDGKFLVEHRNIPGNPATMATASDGSLWIAADHGGVTHWNHEVLAVYGPRQGLTAEELLSLAVDKEGTVWVGSASDGLIRIRDGRVTTFSPSNGLFSYTVGTVTDDLHGWLWMTTNKGVFKVKKSELDDVANGVTKRVNSIVYGTPDGMRTAECGYDVSPAASLAPDGRLWFSSSEGLVSILPSTSTTRSSKPNAVIEDVVIDNVRTGAAGIFKTRAGDHDVEFNFTAPDFAAPERLRFRYRLEGFDHDWNDVGNREQAFYTHLPPGNYTMLVQANDGSGWPAQSASFSLVVTPHFWQTTWFLGLFIVLVLLCGWAGYEVRTVALRRSQRVLQEQVVVRTAELQKAMRNAEAAQHDLQELATRDSLTLLWNRRHIFNMLSNEANRAEREHLSLCVLLLDVDHFKLVNDTHGHLGGDRVLQAVSNVLIEQTRPYDCAGRYGGEEFLIILCNCTLENGIRRANMIREAVAEAQVEWNGHTIGITASIGVALHTPGKSIDSALDQADRALYLAKQTGRNRVCGTTGSALEPSIESGAVRTLLDRSTERLAALRLPALSGMWDRA